MNGMANVLQAAQQEGLLDSCLAWVTYHDIQHGRQVPETTVFAEHWQSLDGLDLAWEQQTMDVSDYGRRDLFVQVRLIKD